MVVVAFLEDLLFLSRIQSALPLAAVRRIARVDGLRAAKPDLVVLDLDSQRVDSLGALAALREDPALRGARTIGFFSHVHPERARAASEAGCQKIVPRSALLAELARIGTEPQ
jgi:DNA-binding NarL/FixJ family response regulator